MTTTRGRSARLVRAALALGAGVIIPTAVGAHAAPVPCGGPHPEPTRVETLGVGIAAAPPVVTGKGAVAVEVHVTRHPTELVGAAERVGGATVHVRITAGTVTSHVWAHTDEHGIATARLTPRATTPDGPATLTAEAWSAPDTPLGCLATIEEHGLVEHGIRVGR